MFVTVQNGLLSALPYIGFWLTIVVSGQLADIVRGSGLLTTTQTRKVGNTIGKIRRASHRGCFLFWRGGGRRGEVEGGEGGGGGGGGGGGRGGQCQTDEWRLSKRMG